MRRPHRFALTLALAALLATAAAVLPALRFAARTAPPGQQLLVLMPPGAVREEGAGIIAAAGAIPLRAVAAGMGWLVASHGPGSVAALERRGALVLRLPAFGVGVPACGAAAPAAFRL